MISLDDQVEKLLEYRIQTQLDMLDIGELTTDVAMSGILNEKQKSKLIQIKSILLKNVQDFNKVLEEIKGD